jgi:hypothetical protein
MILPEAGAIYVMDRGYVDFARLYGLHQAGAWQMIVASTIAVIGLVVTFLGAGCGFYGTWVSKDQAVEIGVMRLSGETKEENLQLPAVKNLLSQAEFSKYRFLFDRDRHCASDRECVRGEELAKYI